MKTISSRDSKEKVEKKRVKRFFGRLLRKLKICSAIIILEKAFSIYFSNINRNFKL